MQMLQFQFEWIKDGFFVAFAPLNGVRKTFTKGIPLPSLENVFISAADTHGKILVDSQYQTSKKPHLIDVASEQGVYF